MTSSEFINKFKSKYLWGNIGAMILVLVLLCAGVKYGIDIYTHHGEARRISMRSVHTISLRWQQQAST